MSLAGLAAAFDLVVVGAGPAGLAAAAEAAGLGLSVLVADENAAAGGQIFRAVATTPLAGSDVLGSEYRAGEALVRALDESAAAFAPRTSVWMVDPGPDGAFSVGLFAAGEARLVAARFVLLAPGALERPFPIPGWTLPGVMTAGAGQALLKASGIVPEGPTVLAGTGPLLFLVAAQYARAGVPIAALLDTTPRANWRGALGAAPGFLVSAYARKGAALLAEARRAAPVVAGVTALAAIGEGAVREVAYEAQGSRRRLAARTLLLHQGVVPQVNLAIAAGCIHRWNDERLAFEPQRDFSGETTVPGVFVAGDAGGIAGAAAAAASGRIAALAIAARAGRLDAAARDARAAPLRRALARALHGRRFLDRIFRPADRFRIPADDVPVCRCEEVAAGAIRAATARGAQGPNQAKAFLRAGMGPCQGRLCGLTVSEIMAQASGRTVEEIGHFNLRNPVKPITLGALAALRRPLSPVRETGRG